MKRQIRGIMCVVALLFALLAGCKAPVAQQSGKEDIAYLLFVSPDVYAGKEVTVTLDGEKPFLAKVVEERKSNRKGTRYGVKTGTRSIKVTCDGKTLYGKKIFVSTQEVKQIILP